MASIFGHALTAVTIGSGFSKKIKDKKFWFLGILCAIIPDADVIGFQFHIPYESFWGHRGFSHSILFAVFLGILVTALFYSKSFFSKKGLLFMAFFTLCTVSHALLDGLTNGGLGVALFSPFDNTRYFLPWRPIQVSPIGASRFFSHWGLKVIYSELYYIGIPALLYIVFVFFVKRFTKHKHKAERK
ncbi:inner membrane protein [Tenacibaculum sp. MAR_2009_124]|uniref:metal-dependent hydrolase n=1 Tax=Tenacibaculum sp. MAR_2009_124 TaxID=1250059 RepID=UPI000898AAEB|nr:metal-dependent hydrolase [Tenacibaculum sp. MAR_2009_124]SEC40871.1 inner membrane protein [Tenacibaculum sp. MAR_2009_124]